MKKFFALLVLSGAVVAGAQTDKGSIRGTVADAGGAVVPNATIKATNTETGATSTTTSNESGTYSVAALPPGTYRVEVIMEGFKTVLQDRVVVELGGTSGFNPKLSAGSTSQRIEVSADIPALKTQQSDVSTSVPLQAFEDLPLSAGGGRQATAFRALVPGVNGSSVNGGPQFGGEIQVDGASVQTSELFGDNRNIRFPPDAVEELSLTTSSYSAEYGVTGDGIERYSIRSGTNRYHGSVYEYLKNTAFDAKGYFNKTTPVDHQNEYGFTLGGPLSIPHLYHAVDKTFFFFNADWYRQKNGGAIATLSLPNDRFRAGDFSQLLPSKQLIYDPNTTVCNGAAGCTRQAFAGNIISPATRFSPAALKILSFLPHSTTQDVLNNTFVPASPSFNQYDTYTMKGDHYFTPGHHLALTYSYSTNPSGGGSVLPAPISNVAPNTNIYHVARASYDSTITSSLLNQLRFAFNRQTQNTNSGDANAGFPTQLGLGGGFNTSAGFFPAVGLGPFAGLASGHILNEPIANTYILSDALSWTVGRHNAKFGMEIRDIRHGLIRNLQTNIGFSRNETAFPTSALLSSTGSEFASFLLGAVSSSNIPNFGNVSPNYYWKNIDFYAQDDFRFTPKLTINLGLRTSIFTPMRERNNLYSAVDLRVANPSAGGLPGSYVFAGRNEPRTIAYADRTLAEFGPRLGFAYSVTPRAVLRGGYGISYFPTGAYGAGNNTYSVDGFTTNSSISSPDQINPAFQLDAGFPLSRLVTPNLTSSFNVGQGFNYYDPTAARVSQMQSFNVATQYAIQPNLTLDVAYVGTKGTDLTLRGNVNQVDPKYLALGDNLLRTNINDIAVKAAGFTPPWPGFSAALGANATLAQALRPFPQYQGGYDYSSDNRGNSTYHSLQVKLEKRYSNGLYLLSSYTWSKYITNANITFAGFASTVRNQYDLSLDKSIAAAWQPHVLTTAFNYELPIGRGKKLLRNANPITNAVVGGWHLNGILSYHSGGLISLGVPNNLPIFAGPAYATVLPGVKQKGDFSGNPRTAHYLNIAAFALPAPDTFGTGKKYLPNLRTPVYLNEDLSLIKTVPIYERFNLELRFETFNAFNRTILGGPNTDITNPSVFGTVNGQANGARTGQFVAKVNF